MLTIFKGDDTGGSFGKKLVVKIDTEISLDGCQVVFQFCSIRKTFTNVKNGDELEIFYSHNETRMMPLGVVRGTIYVIDAAGKIRTLTNTYPIKVTANAAECYGADAAFATITIRECEIHWDDIGGKPTEFPPKHHTHGAADLSGVVKTVNGNQPDENGNIEVEGGGIGEVMLSVTYAQLVALRSEGKLVAGAQYRITDYVATTTQDETRSANHPFDIIVTADSPTVLNEVARAALHEGDAYFANCDISAWQVWYTVDNDENRFGWADANGKGVIYRLIDEFENDVPYDFKGIVFLPYNSTDGVYRYTFDRGTSAAKDLSLSFDNHVRTNIIRPTAYTYGVFAINKIAIFGEYAISNAFDSDCGTITIFGGGNGYNRFGCYCEYISLENAIFNKFADYCYLITAKENFTRNSFGESATSIEFGKDCDCNQIAAHCGDIIFGNNCKDNKLKENNVNHIVSNNSSGNVFGDGCDSITSEGSLLKCTFGDDVMFIALAGATDCKFDYYAYNITCASRISHVHVFADVSDYDINPDELGYYTDIKYSGAVTITI